VQELQKTMLRMLIRRRRQKLGHVYARLSKAGVASERLADFTPMPEKAAPVRTRNEAEPDKCC